MCSLSYGKKFRGKNTVHELHEFSRNNLGLVGRGTVVHI
jgi:hypothetical protein